MSNRAASGSGVISYARGVIIYARGVIISCFILGPREYRGHRAGCGKRGNNTPSGNNAVCTVYVKHRYRTVIESGRLNTANNNIKLTFPDLIKRCVSIKA